MKNRALVITAFSCSLLLFSTGSSHAMGRKLPTPAPAAQPSPDAHQETLSEEKPGSEAHPKIVFKEKDFDFGEAIGVTKVDHVFTFRNEGNAELKIDKVQPTCGCTAALLSAKLIPPGGEGEIKTTFRFGARQGKQLKHIYVNSNDLKEPKVRLSITGVIVPPVSVEPKNIHFYDAKEGLSKKIKITQTMDEELDLKEPTTRLELINTTLKEEPSKDGKKRYILDVSVKPDLQPGRYFEHVIIATNIQAKPEIKIPVRINVRGDIEVAPSRIKLGALAPGQEVKRRVSVSNHKRKPFRIDKVEIDNKDFSVDLATPTESKTSHQFELLFIPREKTGTVKAKIALHTDYEAQKKLEVNAYGYIRERTPRPRSTPPSPEGETGSKQ